MADTPNYGLKLSAGSDLMSDVKSNITDNFKIIAPRNDITVIPAGNPLPQSGNYNIGDRVFRDDPIGGGGNTWPSNYILVVKDANWGWHWRPVQQILSPWINIPATAIADSGYIPYLAQIAMDNRGFVYWRGCIRSNTPGLPANTSIAVFKQLPVGLRPNVAAMYTVGVSPITGGATGKAGNISGRLFLSTIGTSSFRWFNTNNGVSQNIWVSSVMYNASDTWFTSA